MKIYLGGSMTAKRDLGRTWRRKLTPFLEKLGFGVEDPTVFEEDLWKPLMKDHNCNSMSELKAKDPHAHADIMKLIEKHDIQRMLSCDVVLFLVDAQVFMSDGTISEMREAMPIDSPPKLDCLFVLRTPWTKVWSWTAWRMRRYGVERGKLFYSMIDLKAYMKEMYGGMAKKVS